MWLIGNTRHALDFVRPAMIASLMFLWVSLRSWINPVRYVLRRYKSKGIRQVRKYAYEGHFQQEGTNFSSLRTPLRTFRDRAQNRLLKRRAAQIKRPKKNPSRTRITSNCRISWGARRQESSENQKESEKARKKETNLTPSHQTPTH